MKLAALVGGTAAICGPETSVADAARQMERLEVGSLGVIDEGRLAGIFTERDVLRAVAADADTAAEPVSAWMSPDPDVFAPEVDVEEAARWLLETGYRHLPVMADGELLGIVSIRDVLWALVGP